MDRLFITIIIATCFGSSTAQNLIQEYTIPKKHSLEQMFPLGDSLFITYKEYNYAILAKDDHAGWVYKGAFTEIYFADMQKSELVGLMRIGKEVYIYFRDHPSGDDVIRILSLDESGRRSLSAPISIGFTPDFIFYREGLFLIGHQFGKKELRLARLIGLDVTQQTIPFPSPVSKGVNSTEAFKKALSVSSNQLHLAFDRKTDIYVWRINLHSYATSEFTTVVHKASHSSIALSDSCIYRLATYGSDENARVEVLGLDKPEIKLALPINLDTHKKKHYSRPAVSKNVQKTTPGFNWKDRDETGITFVSEEKFNSLVISSGRSLPPVINNWRAPKKFWTLTISYFYLRETKNHKEVIDSIELPELLIERVDAYELANFEGKEIPFNNSMVYPSFLDKVYIFEEPDRLAQVRFTRQ